MSVVGQHDPLRYADFLRQGLSQDKRPLALLLGAGCAYSIKVKNGETSGPLVPDVKGLTDIVLAKLAAKADCATHIKSVVTQIAAGNKSPNVEDILTHVRLLRSIAGNDVVRGLRAEDLERLERSVCEVIVGEMDRRLPSGGTPYSAVASWVGTARRAHPVEIFTPNYDLLMEQAMESAHVPYFDGFLGSFETFFDPHAMEEDKLPQR